MGCFCLPLFTFHLLGRSHISTRIPLHDDIELMTTSLIFFVCVLVLWMGLSFTLENNTCLRMLVLGNRALSIDLSLMPFLRTWKALSGETSIMSNAIFLDPPPPLVRKLTLHRASYMSKTLMVDNQSFKYQIWDTAGQEKVDILPCLGLSDGHSIAGWLPCTIAGLLQPLSSTTSQERLEINSLAIAWFVS